MYEQNRYESELRLRHEIALVIKDYCKPRKRNLKMLAEKSGITQRAVCFMHNEYGVVSLKNICKLLDFLGYQLIIKRKDEIQL